MSVSRILYVSQSAQIQTSDGNQFFLPIQNANCEMTRPIEDVLSFGLLGAVNRTQNRVTTCRSTLKAFLNFQYNSSTITPAQQGVGGTGYNNTVNANLISKLTGDALAGAVEVINVQPNGFVMSGILARMGLDVADGSLGTADFEFVGVGEPYFYSAPSGILGSVPALNGQLVSVNPVNNPLVSGSAGLGTCSSLKFTLDIPNDTISSLGYAVSGVQAAVSGGYAQVARAPFKADLVVEGASVDPNLQPNNQTYWFGSIGVTFPKPITISRSMNQAVGTAAASYNYTVNDVSANFQ